MLLLLATLHKLSQADLEGVHYPLALSDLTERPLFVSVDVYLDELLGLVVSMVFFSGFVLPELPQVVLHLVPQCNAIIAHEL